MASSVHFKFKSQKEFSRVAFDGTGISVFELKREVISQSKLGDGNDFELAIYNAETGEEYDDDTALVPRTTRVLVRRLPASRPGKGGAARYVSGRMPVNAKSNAKIESSVPNGAAATTAPAPQDLGTAQSEEDKIKALLSLQESQWKVQQEEMANATPVMMGRGRGKPTNIPDHPPPPGYLCYRCREKGHWIQACPTNSDPNFDGHYRVKRSTGIPRSLQKQVERPDGADGVAEDSKVSGVMVNADGDFVIAQPDKASWELYQEKAKAAAAAASEAAAVESSREIEARGLQCPIDKRMFLEPTKTPCCGKTYCNDCITNALIESDFNCPGCGSEEVLLDDLTPNTEMAEKVRLYEAEREELKKRAQERGEEMENQQVSYTTDPVTPVSQSTLGAAVTTAPSASSTPSTAAPAAANGASPTRSTDGKTAASDSTSSQIAKKRPADEDAGRGIQSVQSPATAKKLKRSESPQEQAQGQNRPQSSASVKTPTTSQNSSAAQNTPRPVPTTTTITTAAAATAPTTAATTSTTTTTGPAPHMHSQPMQTPSTFAPMPFMQQPYGSPFGGMPNFPGGMPGMPFPGNPMSMPGFMPGMDSSDGMWNMPNMPFGPANGTFPPNMPFANPMMAGGFMPGFGPNNMGPVGVMNQPQQAHQQLPHQQQQQQQQNMYFAAAQNQMGGFANQQRNAYGASSKEEEHPYLRQPVNPHRHQGRQKRLRPTDFREL